MPSQKIIDLANEAVSWYFNNNIQDTINNNSLPFSKKSANNPKFNNDVWAELMLDAISSFYEGIEGIEINTKRAAKDLYNNAVDLVGDEAFKTIAMIVSAAGVRRSIEGQYSIYTMGEDDYDPETGEAYDESEEDILLSDIVHDQKIKTKDTNNDEDEDEEDKDTQIIRPLSEALEEFESFEIDRPSKEYAITQFEYPDDEELNKDEEPEFTDDDFAALEGLLGFG